MTNATVIENPAHLRQLDPTRLTNEVVEDGARWADLDAAASVLEEGRKGLLAKLTLEAIEGSLAGGGKRPMSATQAELYALSDAQYQTHLTLMVDARRAANHAKVRYDLGRKRLDLIQTAHANLRSEMRMSGMNP